MGTNGNGYSGIPMTITLNELVNMNPCGEGLRRFLEQTNHTRDPVETQSLIGGRNTTEDLLWLANQILPRERIVAMAYALICAGSKRGLITHQSYRQLIFAITTGSVQTLSVGMTELVRIYTKVDPDNVFVNELLTELFAYTPKSLNRHLEVV